MAQQYLMQAVSSETGQLVSWISEGSPDFAGGSFPGPGSPEEIAVTGVNGAAVYTPPLHLVLAEGNEVPSGTAIRWLGGEFYGPVDVSLDESAGGALRILSDAPANKTNLLIGGSPSSSQVILRAAGGNQSANYLVASSVGMPKGIFRYEEGSDLVTIEGLGGVSFRIRNLSAGSSPNDAARLADVSAHDIEAVLQAGSSAGGESLSDLAYLELTPADHETSALTLTSGGAGGASVDVMVGTGAPEHSAPSGTLYLRDNGTPSSGLWLNKSSGSGTSWDPFISAATAQDRVVVGASSGGQAVSYDSFRYQDSQRRTQVYSPETGSGPHGYLSLNHMGNQKGYVGYVPDDDVFDVQSIGVPLRLNHWTFPAADGTDGQALVTDGEGELSWGGPYVRTTGSSPGADTRIPIWTDAETIGSNAGLTFLGQTANQLRVRSPGSGSGPHGFVSQNSGGTVQGWFGYVPFDTVVALTAVNGGEIRGDWEVPAGSTLTVPAPSQDGHAARRQDTLHGGSSAVTWDESLRRLQVFGSASHTAPGYSLRSSADELRGNWEYRESTNQVRLYVDPSVSGAHIVGDWTVPSGSTLSVPEPTQGGHAASMDYVDDAIDALPTLDQGTYSPTFSGLSNLSDITVTYARWVRVGDTVTVHMSLGAEISGSTRQFRFTLPVARPTDFSSTGEGVGHGTTNSASETIGISSSFGQLAWAICRGSGTSGSRTMYLTFTYDLA